MKNLLLGLVFLFTIGVSAQYTQFMEQYESIELIEANGTKSGLKVLNTRIYFNYGGDTRSVKVYLGGKVYNLVQVGTTESGLNSSGELYSSMKLLDETGDNLYLEYYAKEHYVIIVDKDGNIIELE